MLLFKLAEHDISNHTSNKLLFYKIIKYQQTKSICIEM